MRATGLLITFVLVLDISQGCHEYRHVRTKRQSSFGDPSRREAESTKKLRKYFTTCMGVKVGSIWTWRSVVDYAILDTFWYQNSAESNCSRNSDEDSSGCWKTRLGGLLERRSALFAAAESCIDQFSRETTFNRRYRRQADDQVSTDFCRPPRNEPFRPNSEKVKSYSLCGKTEEQIPPYRSVVDFPSVLEFVGDHTVCGSELADCDAGNQETISAGDPDVAKWPYRFEAITKNESPFKPIIVSCNAQIYPLSTGTWGAWSDCTVTCGGGTRRRTRQCNDVKNCKGSEQESCNEDLCKECRISTVSRRNCGAGSTSKQQCLSLGCCHDGGICYRSEDPTSFDPPNFQATSSPDLNFGGDDGFPGTRIKRRCSKTKPCGSSRAGDDSISCLRAGCCWTSNRCTAYIWTIVDERNNCAPGFSNPPACRDINECASNPCPHPLICNDLINSYSCSCPPGVSSPLCANQIWSAWGQWSPCFPLCGPGTRTRTRVCLQVPCSGSLSEGQSCVNSGCSNDPCSPNPCHTFAQCSATTDSFTCACNAGYGGDGFICQEINECLSNPCPTSFTCTDHVNSYSCTPNVNRDCTTLPPYSHVSRFPPVCPCAYTSGSTFNYGCTRSCHVLQGGTSSTCNNGVWTVPSTPPVCQLNADCPSVTLPGSHSTPPACVSDMVQFVCINTSQVIIGPSIATCLATGLLSFIPTCVTPVPRK